MRNYDRGYDEQLRAFYLERVRREEAGYRDDVKIIVSGLLARGENAEHIASLLQVSVQTITGWYRDLFLNQQELAFTIDDFTYIREKNVVRADGRTKGCIVKGIVEETLTTIEAAEAVGVSSLTTIENWVKTYSRDYDIMTTIPAGVDYLIKTAYAYSKEHAEQVQTLIFAHDREENELASQLREEFIAGR